MEVISAKDLSLLRVAKGGDKVHKDECVYCFHSPVSKGGVYVSLSSFMGLCKNHIELHHSKTSEALYLHIVHTVKPIPAASEEVVKDKPTRLAIGMEGGFDGGQQKQEIDETLSVVAMPELTSVPWPCNQLPSQVVESVKGVLAASTASKQDAIAAWDGDKRLVSKHAAQLNQLDNGVKVPPSGWKCAYCDLTSNLWMNLTDGTILCGRKYFDGSGGNNHAVEHYKKTKYPLAVKLGTITPDGGDVYSYDEDDMMEDPNLTQHLQHFGIDISRMTKTDATMTELEIDMNMRIGEWSIIQESGKQLVPCYGTGYTGMANLGNSCYLNSIMQVLFSLPHFKQRYYQTAAKAFQQAPPNPVQDFETQMAKVAVGLLSGDYSQTPDTPSGQNDGKPPAEQPGISPSMFKAVIGKGHPEFSSMRQQDAQEFFLHLLATIDKNERLTGDAVSRNPADFFRFQFEDRVECVVSGKVRYSKRDDFLLQLPVPMEMATNKAEVQQWEAKKKELEANKQRVNPDDTVRAMVPFTACLDKLSKPQHVEDFYSSALKEKTVAKKTLRFATFPEYLMLQVAKFSFGEDWVPKKYDVLIDVPDQLDLSHLKGHGLQPGEEELPEDSSAPPPPAVEVDEGILMQLVSMGFDVEGCMRAVYHTNNQGVEPAMNWVLEHMGDPDFSSPFTPPNAKPQATPTGSSPPEDAIAMVTALGFTREQAIKALRATDNNVERAADWVFSHAGELDTAESMDTGQGQPAAPTIAYMDGPGKYRLVAFVSHMGTSTLCGHYVCHILKEGRWVIYNDSKVAVSETPPRQLGYLYLYQRV